MPIIDFKNATVLVKDGSAAGTTTTTTTSALKVGDTFVPLTSATNFPVGTVFTIGADPRDYVVTALNTLKASVIPRIGLAETTAATVTVLKNTVEAKIGEGNLTYTEKRAVTYVKNRGFLDTVKLGDEDPVEVSLDFTFEFLKSASGAVPTFEEALQGVGNASAWVTTSPDVCEPYCVDILILHVPPCGEYELITLSQFRYEELQHDIKQGQIAVKGSCNVTKAVIAHT